MTVFLSICISVFLSYCLFVFISVYPSHVYISAWISVSQYISLYVFVYVFIYFRISTFLSFCLFLCLSVFLYFCPSVFLSFLLLDDHALTIALSTAIYYLHTHMISRSIIGYIILTSMIHKRHLRSEKVKQGQFGQHFKMPSGTQFCAYILI